MAFEVFDIEAYRIDAFAESDSAPAINGTAALVTPRQTISAVGTAKIAGLGQWVTPRETIGTVGASLVSGLVNLNTPRETISAIGMAKVSGVVNEVTPRETISASGNVLVGGVSNLTTPSRTISVSGTVAIAGTSALLTPSQTILVEGSVPLLEITGSVSLTTPIQSFIASNYIPPVPLEAQAGGFRRRKPVKLSKVIGQAKFSSLLPAFRAHGTVEITGSLAMASPASSVSLKGSVGVVGSSQVVGKIARLKLAGRVPRLLETVEMDSVKLYLYSDMSIALEIPEGLEVDVLLGEGELEIIGGLK